MKFGLLIYLMLVVPGAFAQTMGEKRIKEEMLQRVEALISKLKETRENLKHDEPTLEEVGLACKNIQILFGIYPDHVKAVGTRMNLFEKRTIETKNEALAQLIFFHRQSLLCREGRDFEHVDPKLLSRELKDIEKSLGKQKKNIDKSDTSFENSFFYEYEF